MPGGKRKGSGRKPVPNKKVRKSITLRPDHIERMAGEKVSTVIEKALDKHFKENNMTNIFDANVVVYYNPGQYESMQEKFFTEKRDAIKFMKSFCKQSPHGRVQGFLWDKDSQEPIESARFYANDDI